MRDSHSSIAVAAALLLGLVLAGNGLSLGAQAQAPPPDVVLHPLVGPNPFVIDGGQSLAIRVQNRGAFPVSGAIRFYHPDTSSEANNFATRTFSVNGTGNVTVVLPWNGHMPPESDTVLRGQHTIHAKMTLDAPFDTPPQSVRSLILDFHHFAVRVEPVAPAGVAITPGESKHQEIRIRNLGNQVDDVVVGIATQTTGWAFQLDRTRVESLPPDAFQTVLLTATAPHFAHRDEQGSATIRAQSATLPGAVHEATSSTFIVEGVSGFRLDMEPATMAIEAGHSGTFAVTALNQGNQPADLAFQGLETPGIPPLVLDPTSLHLDPGQSGTVTARLGTGRQTAAGDYLVRVRAADQAGTSRDASASVFVPQHYGLFLTWPADELASRTIEPADSDSYRVRVENTGNGPDRFLLTGKGLPSSWTAAGSDASLQVPASAVHDYLLQVSVPLQTPPGTYSFQIVARSESDASVSRQLSASTQVPSAPALALTPVADKLPIEEGKSRDFDVLVRNVGNVRDTISLPAPVIESAEPASGWAATWKAGETSIEPGATVTRTVHVEAPADLEVSSEARIRIEARTSTGRPASATLTAQSAAADLQIQSLNLPARFYAEREATIGIVVSNRGTLDAPDPVEVHVTIHKQFQVVLERTLKLPGLAWMAGLNTSQVSVKWTPPQAGTYSFRAVADPNGTIEEKSGDDLAPGSNNVRVADLPVRTFNLQLLAPSAREAEAGERIHFDATTAFQLKNLGDAEEQVALSVSTPHGWAVSVSPAAATLGALQTRIVSVTLNVPAVPGRLEEEVRVDAAVEGAGTVPATVKVTIRDQAAPVFASATLDPDAVVMGGTLNVSAVVTDTTGVDAVQAVVTSESGARSTKSLAKDPSTPNLWRAELAADAPGLHQVVLTASDKAVPPNTGSTQGTSLRFWVAAEGAPLIRFVGGSENQTYRGVDALTVTVTDAHGIRRVAYSIHSRGDPDEIVLTRRLPLGNPYNLALAGVQEGAFTVRVEAENLYSNATNASRDIHVDNTPPRIVLVNVEPAPDGERRVVVTVEPASDLAAVEVVLRMRDLSVLRIEAAVASIADTYVAVVPAEDVLDWRVITRDGAGNEDLREFSAGAGSALQGGGTAPGPAPWAALVAGFVAILGRAWRRRAG